MAAAAGLVDPVAAVDRAAAAGTVVPEDQWAAAQPHPGASSAAVHPAVGAGTAVPDTAQATRLLQPAVMELLWLIALPCRLQKVRRLITRLPGTVLLPTQC
jgi:hypothetical protein